MATKLDKTAGGPATLRPANALAPAPVNSLLQAVVDPFARAYQTYQQHIGQPFQQAVRGGVRGYFGLPLMSDADPTGREAYRQGEALGYTPGVGMPAGAVRVAAEGAQALPLIAGDIGRVIAGMPSGAARAQAEDFARYQRSIPSSDVSPLTAFHGTPHTFDPTAANPLGEFRAAKIGSGEGTQAFGYGMYFAESPEVAKEYQTMLSQNKVLAVFRGNDGYYVKEGLGDTGKNVAGPFRTGAEAEQVRKSLPQPKGLLYTVDIPDSMVEKMIDMDAPIEKAGQKVIDYFKSFNAYKPGQPLTKHMAVDKFMAEDLRKMGIPGLRYLDYGSRAAGEGTRNIVVFPGEEKNVKILSRD